MLRNGQRKYGGPPQNWTGPPPTKGSEVFVGKIPRDVMEDELLSIFEAVGSVFEIRLMMDFNGANRGFAFVTFATPTDATKAIQKFNRFEIRPRRFIGVMRSLDNCRLFIGGIPKDKSEEDIREEMSRLTDGVVGVILYSAIEDKTKNRGFAFVEYESHRSAVIARKKYTPGKLQLWGKSIAVDWAEPEPTVEEEILSKVRVLYVRNLMVHTPEKELEDLFNASTDNGVEKVKVLNDYAFVHFASRLQAQQAMDSLQDLELNGAKIHITWAKPVTNKNKRIPQSQLGGSSRTAIPVMSHQSYYPATVSHIWPHVTFSHPTAILPHLNGLPLHVIPSYFYQQQNSACNYIIPDRSHNQIPAYLLHNDFAPQLPSDFIHQQTNVTNSSQQEGFLPVVDGNYTSNVKILTRLCWQHGMNEPAFETCATADHRYVAKVTIDRLGPRFNVFQVAGTYKTENEAREAIAGYVINHLNQVLSVPSESSFC